MRDNILLHRVTRALFECNNIHDGSSHCERCPYMDRGCDKEMHSDALELIVSLSNNERSKELTIKEKLTIKVNYLRGMDEFPLKRIAAGDWIDLHAAEDVELLPFQSVVIPLGVAMQLPDGYEATIAPRSSTFGKYRLIMANSIGIIDNAYCGNEDEWNFIGYSFGDAKIKRGDRICQFRIQKRMPEVEIMAVSELTNPNRGGLGSTGR